jgi:hypothetical protein
VLFVNVLKRHYIWVYGRAMPQLDGSLQGKGEIVAFSGYAGGAKAPRRSALSAESDATPKTPRFPLSLAKRFV